VQLHARFRVQMVPPIHHLASCEPLVPSSLLPSPCRAGSGCRRFKLEDGIGHPSPRTSPTWEGVLLGPSFCARRSRKSHPGSRVGSICLASATVAFALGRSRVDGASSTAATAVC
jgi:hypothetical protein